MTMLTSRQSRPKTRRLKQALGLALVQVVYPAANRPAGQLGLGRAYKQVLPQRRLGTSRSCRLGRTMLRARMRRTFERSVLRGWVRGWVHGSRCPAGRSAYRTRSAPSDNGDLVARPHAEILCGFCRQTERGQAGRGVPPDEDVAGRIGVQPHQARRRAQCQTLCTGAGKRDHLGPRRQSRGGCGGVRYGVGHAPCELSDVQLGHGGLCGCGGPSQAPVLGRPDLTSGAALFGASACAVIAELEFVVFRLAAVEGVGVVGVVSQPLDPV